MTYDELEKFFKEIGNEDYDKELWNPLWKTAFADDVDRNEFYAINDVGQGLKALLSEKNVFKVDTFEEEVATFLSDFMHKSGIRVTTTKAPIELLGCKDTLLSKFPDAKDKDVTYPLYCNEFDNYSDYYCPVADAKLEVKVLKPSTFALPVVLSKNTSICKAAD